MKQILVVALIALLTSCAEPPSEWTVSTRDLSSVKGLEGCIYRAVSMGDRSVTVVRCPHSDTSVIYSVGKSQATVTTIDGNENFKAPTAVETPNAPQITTTGECNVDVNVIIAGQRVKVPAGCEFLPREN